jgi:hypothetical protein
VWQERVPAKLRDEAPGLVTDDQGEAWLWAGNGYTTTGLSAAAGKQKEEFSPLPLSYADMREGCYDSRARIADMDRDGVLAAHKRLQGLTEDERYLVLQGNARRVFNFEPAAPPR